MPPIKVCNLCLRFQQLGPSVLTTLMRLWVASCTCTQSLGISFWGRLWRWPIPWHDFDPCTNPFNQRYGSFPTSCTKMLLGSHSVSFNNVANHWNKLKSGTLPFITISANESLFTSYRDIQNSRDKRREEWSFSGSGPTTISSQMAIVFLPSQQKRF